ncbi:MAG TPA: ribosomal protein S19 family protein [Candidatus Nanoarchaeia archaeon]|nr:ribosomal protein S19 family protein [Candidatus Nanoarchaeia archaeon]
MIEQELRKKEFVYRGKIIDELKQINIREFAKLTTSRQRRAILRNFQEIENFVNRCKSKINKNKKIRTHKRTIIIVPEMIGMNIQVYNGNKFIPVQIIGEMLGHRLGEFAPSRGRITHSKSGVGSTKGSKSKSKK